MRVPALLAVALLLFALPAHALPGEADAVLKYCGTPQSESRGVSPVTSNMQRSFLYRDLILHFEPAGAGWSFTTAWHGHLPMTRDELERRLPCFRIAMQQVAAAPAAAIDPTIAQQTGPREIFNDNTFGIPHFWGIVGLVVLLIVLMLIPSAKARAGNRKERQRKATLAGHAVHDANRQHVVTHTTPPKAHPDLDDV